MSAMPATTDDRYPLTIERTRLDGEERISMHLRDVQAPWAQVAVRVFVPEEGEAMLHAAFGIDALTVAMAEDIAPQEAANAAMISALREVFGARAATLFSLLDDAWDRTLDRLNARWTQIAKKKPNPDALCLWHYKTDGGPALVGRTTQPGIDTRFGICRARARYDSLRSYGSIVLPTREMLMKIPTLSGHEKLDLMGAKGVEYARVRAIFDQRRRGMMEHDAVWPMRDRTMLGVSRDWGGSVLMADGDSGEIGHWGDTVRIVRTFKRDRHDIVVEAKKGGPLKINRFRGKDERFKSPDQLDSALRRLIAMLLAWDDPLPDWSGMEGAAPFDPAHPAVADMDIPPRYQAFIGAMLGAPYDKARKRAVAKAAKVVGDDAKAAVVADLPKQVADGALFGTTGALENGHVKLMMATTSRLSVARRKRCLKPVCGAGINERPLTPKNIAKLPLLDDPDALRLVRDTYLQQDRRDVMEAAFRLSFSLEPQARNPLLETDGHVEIMDDLHGRERLRVTRHPGAEGCALLAFTVTARLAREKDDRMARAGFPVPTGWRDRPGAALLAETVFGERRFYLRPSYRYDGTISLPPNHRATIEAGIERLHVTGRIDDDDAAAIRAGLATEWATLSKEYGA